MQLTFPECLLRQTRAMMPCRPPPSAAPVPTGHPLGGHGDRGGLCRRLGAGVTRRPWAATQETRTQPSGAAGSAAACGKVPAKPLGGRGQRLLSSRFGSILLV